METAWRSHICPQGPACCVETTYDHLDSETLHHFAAPMKHKLLGLSLYQLQTKKR